MNSNRLSLILVFHCSQKTVSCNICLERPLVIEEYNINMGGRFSLHAKNALNNFIDGTEPMAA